MTSELLLVSPDFKRLSADEYLNLKVVLVFRSGMDLKVVSVYDYYLLLNL